MNWLLLITAALIVNPNLRNRILVLLGLASTESQPLVAAPTPVSLLESQQQYQNRACHNDVSSVISISALQPLIQSLSSAVARTGRQLWEVGSEAVSRIQGEIASLRTSLQIFVTTSTHIMEYWRSLELSKRVRLITALAAPVLSTALFAEGLRAMSAAINAAATNSSVTVLWLRVSPVIATIFAVLTRILPSFTPTIQAQLLGDIGEEHTVRDLERLIAEAHKAPLLTYAQHERRVAGARRRLNRAHEAQISNMVVRVVPSLFDLCYQIVMTFRLLGKPYGLVTVVGMGLITLAGEIMRNRQTAIEGQVFEADMEYQQRESEVSQHAASIRVLNRGTFHTKEELVLLKTQQSTRRVLTTEMQSTGLALLNELAPHMIGALLLANYQWGRGNGQLHDVLTAVDLVRTILLSVGLLHRGLGSSARITHSIELGRRVTAELQQAVRDRQALPPVNDLDSTQAIVVRDLTVSRAGRILCQEINLEIAPGELVVISGTSGLGKSSLLQVLLGLLDAQAGRVWVFGRALSGMSQAEKARMFAAALQHPELFAAKPVMYNVLYALAHDELLLQLVGLSTAAAIKEQAYATAAGKRLYDVGVTALRKCGIGYLEERDDARISGGEQRRLTIAQALARQTAMRIPILMLDEPTDNLDATTALGIIELIASLRCTRIVVTHQPEAFDDATKYKFTEEHRLALMATSSQSRMAVST